MRIVVQVVQIESNILESDLFGGNIILATPFAMVDGPCLHL